MDYYWLGKRDGIIERHRQRMEENEKRRKAFEEKAAELKAELKAFYAELEARDRKIDQCLELLDEYDRIGKESA